MATADVAGEVFNIGPDSSENEITMTGLAEKVLMITGCGLDIEYHPARPGEVHTATCSADKARRLLGYEPRWALEDGLAELAWWIKERGPREFDYHLPIEITNTPLQAPRTWTERLM
jgi:UDP-glucose 4-epimerase